MDNKKEVTVGYCQEEQGVNSATRLIFVIGSLWNIAMTTFIFVKGVDYAGCLAFFSGVEAVLLGLKLGQKAMETPTTNVPKV